MSGTNIPAGVAPRMITEACPCDTCPHTKLCAGGEHACRAFERFVAGKSWEGFSQKPSEQMFQEVFVQKTFGRPKSAHLGGF